MRIMALHPAAMATCEWTFSLNRIVKTEMRAAMTDARMNHLHMCKHCADVLEQVNIDEIMKEFMNSNERRIRAFGMSLH